MEKKSENLIIFFLVVFSLYCSLILGMSWDEPYHYDLGKNRLKYLFSLGRYEYISPFFWTSNSSHFPGFYDTLSAFVSQILPRRYEVEIQLGRVDESHIIRTIEYWDIEKKHIHNTIIAQLSLQKTLLVDSLMF